MRYISTRGEQSPVAFTEALLQGIAADGGLFVPEHLPEAWDWTAMQRMSYVELATYIISGFVPESLHEQIRLCCCAAYDQAHFPDAIVPVRRVGEVYVAELFHGRTAAFKDMALSLLPYLMTMALRHERAHNTYDKVRILTATSGDTGKAALEGFRDVPDTEIVVFYPTDGVSTIQKQQMVTQQGANVHVFGIRGNFDDAQSAVKQALVSPLVREQYANDGYLLSSANSINIGRLLPQIVYYVWTYLELVRQGVLQMGDPIRLGVPSGNFGNCLAGWIASRMGLPVSRFIVASNRNHILTDFFTTGVYDTRRTFYQTVAPAMDILVSSNLERLLWYVADAPRVALWMQQLRQNGVFSVDADTLATLRSFFSAAYVEDEPIRRTIGDCYRQTAYLMDTHTACAYAVQPVADTTPTVIMSTASPYKFPETVWQALSGAVLPPYEAMTCIEAQTHLPVPLPLQHIREREVLHCQTLDKSAILDCLLHLS